MKNAVSIFVLLIAVYLAVPGFSRAQESKPAIDFNRQVKPILSDRCFLCHGPDQETREAGLRLDTKEGAESVLTAGDSEDSDLYYRVMLEDDDEQMPPADSNLSLTAEEKKILKQWIDEGAKWEQHWSFVAPKKNPLPETKSTSWSGKAIDQFVMARLEKEKLSPAPFASKEKLLRRVTFDLTGLPPTLDELDAFLADETDEAYEKVVDRLLASKRYGERMTSDWLDLARYSDTYGYQVDRDRFVWPWRDWVVRSFNRNMRYDQFLTEQLAGDLLPDATDDQILATTFNRLHPQKVEGGSVEEEFRVEYVADRSQTVGMAFMGLTVECARCHDHKYDPLSQKEYYELFAFFNNIDEAGLYSYFDPKAIPSPSLLLTDEAKKKKLSELRTRVAELESKIADRQSDSVEAFKSWLEKQKDFKTPSEMSGLQTAVDFEKATLAKNKLIDLDDGTKGIQLTGDDEVKLETGLFKRHQPFTISTRIKIPDDKELLKRTVIYHRSRAWTDSASRGYQLLIKNGKLSASLIHFWPGNAISVETEVVPTEKWIHVAFAYDGSSRADGIKIFIDGELAKLTTIKDNLQKQITGGGTDHLILGARFRDIGFKKGELADMKIFERELTSMEIGELMTPDSMAAKLKSGADEMSQADQKMCLDYFLANDDESYQAALTELAAARSELNSTTDAIEEIMVMQELPEPRPAFVLARGAYDAPTEPVTANTPAVLPKFPQGENANRLGLARWLTSPEHPLTARVAVNHYWQLLFGQGLVRTPEDFGSQGQPPTHPKLLDWLAVDFQENGWDVKRLMKQIVLTSTYRQSTVASKELLKIDPDNKLLARMSTVRLPAEMIRDNVLFTSGLLVEKMGGAPVRPYELEKSFQPSEPDKGDGLYRRSLYTFWKRTGPAPVMLTLDAAKRDVCQVKRERTSSPLAALVQLNNPQTVEASRKLAEKLTGQHEFDSEKIVVDLFRTLASRFPTKTESKIVLSLFESQLEYFEADVESAKSFLNVGDSKTETKKFAELAAWSSVANTLFSFDECVMKR